MSVMYDIPEDMEELFQRGDQSYSITDPEQPGDNVFGMDLFLDLLGVTGDMVKNNDGTQVTLIYKNQEIVIDSGGLGDFHLHGFDVTFL